MLEMYARGLSNYIGCAGAFRLLDRSPIRHFAKSLGSGYVTDCSTDDISSELCCYSQKLIHEWYLKEKNNQPKGEF